MSEIKKSRSRPLNPIPRWTPRVLPEGLCNSNRSQAHLITSKLDVILNGTQPRPNWNGALFCLRRDRFAAPFRNNALNELLMLLRSG